MNVIIISIDHYLQLLESDTDLKALRASKSRLREILEAQFAGGGVAEIFEESSPRKESIADSGIMKWPTSAVCFGPPLGQSELLVFTERELRTGAGVGLENQGGALRTDSPGV
jgi:hypothetical protein